MYSYSLAVIVGYIGTVTAPSCNIAKSTMHHSVLLLVDIRAILSPFFTPISNNELLNFCTFS